MEDDHVAIAERLRHALQSADAVPLRAVLETLFAQTADEGAAEALQANGALRSALVATVKRLNMSSGPSTNDDNEDLLELTTGVMANLAGHSRPHNGRPMNVVVEPLPQDDIESFVSSSSTLRVIGDNIGDGDNDSDGNGDGVPTALRVSVQPLDYVEGEIGYKLWDCGHVLSRLLLSRWGRRLLAGRRVVELGSGLGLCGFVAAAQGAAHVTLSDYQSSLVRNLQASIARNTDIISDASSITAIELDWTTFSSTSLSTIYNPAIATLYHDVDVVIGSDLVFEEAALALPFVLDYLLRPGGMFVSINAASHVSLVPGFDETLRKHFPSTTQVHTVPSTWYAPTFRRSPAEPEHHLYLVTKILDDYSDK